MLHSETTEFQQNHYRQVPTELKALRRWCRWSTVNGSKLPSQVNGAAAKSNDESTWTDFETVEPFDRVATFLKEPYCGVDLDGCLDDSGKLKPWAVDLVARLSEVSYSEISPSGLGIKFITRARKPDGSRCVHKIGHGKQQIECYDHSRFWTVTGEVYASCDEIKDGQAVIDWLCREYLNQHTNKVKTPKPQQADALMQRATRWMQSVEPASEGERNNKAFSAAGHLWAFVDDAGSRLSESQIAELMADWNAGNQPPLPEAELQRAIASARTNGTPRADKLPAGQVKNENRYAVDVDAKNAGKRSKRVDTADRFVPFPLKDLGPVLADFCQQVAASVGCDPAFPATYALAVCASAIGSSRSIFLKPDWPVPCILWTMCIGESGSGKSPPLRACMEPLNVRRSAYNAEFTQAMTEFRREYREYKKRMKDYDRGEIDAEPPEPKRPLHRRCSMNDTTIHAIAGVLADNARGVLLCRDELSGWLTGFDRFSKGRSGASAECPIWLELYNANSIEVDRKSECQYLAVESPHVSITGGIQPGIFKRAMSSEMQDNGLQARFLMTYPPRGVKQWRDDSLSDDTREKYQRLIDALFELKQESLPGQNLCPAALSLSAEAKRLLQCWVDRHGVEQHTMTGLLAATWSKMEEAPGRLSIVLHCVQQVTNGVEDHFAVSADVMQQALSIAEWFKSEALRIHRLMQEPNGASEQRSLIQWIRGRGGRITANELRRNRRDLRDRPAEEAETVLQMLVNGGLGDWHSIKGSREFVAIDDALST